MRIVDAGHRHRRGDRAALDVERVLDRPGDGTAGIGAGIGRVVAGRGEGDRVQCRLVLGERRRAGQRQHAGADVIAGDAVWLMKLSWSPAKKPAEIETVALLIWRRARRIGIGDRQIIVDRHRGELLGIGDGLACIADDRGIAEKDLRGVLRGLIAAARIAIVVDRSASASVPAVHCRGSSASVPPFVFNRALICAIVPVIVRTLVPLPATPARCCRR